MFDLIEKLNDIKIICQEMRTGKKHKSIKKGIDPKINYLCKIIFHNNCIARAGGTSKKKAEENAAVIAVRVLKINTNLNEKKF